ncbi:MAG: ATP-binding cassette domain-containing protein [Nitrososphaerales archaeon]|jgi:ABC-2 type transport system ATP-binding protein
MKAIEVNSLTKVYSNGTKAVDDISFSVEEGEIFGLLGPNGAGKTTTIKVITTLARPTAGSVKVFGIDVQRAPQDVRQMLGFVPQAISVDGDLTGYENLLIFAKLFFVGREERKRRILDALEYFGLADRANELVKNYSGGMMRRLEIAQALVNRPRILFLDEPSIGLDPYSKMQVIHQIQELNREFGTTILVTTHDMAEADVLCNRLAIMNLGKIAVSGAPSDLKRSVGGDVLTVKMSGEAIASLPAGLGSVISSEQGTTKVLVETGETAIPRLTQYFERNGAVVESVSLNRPTLDDVFMKYAKGGLQQEGTFREARSARRSITRHGR